MSRPRRAVFALLACALLASIAGAQEQAEAPTSPPDIYIKENDSLVITVPNLTRVAVGDPMVVGATIVSPHEVLLQGQPISITGSTQAAFQTFQQISQTLASVTGDTRAAASTGGTPAKAFFAVSNVYVWSGEQRYVYRVVVVNVVDEAARPPFLSGYRIDIAPDRLILSGIAESEERKAAAERILTAQGFKIENKITVLDRPLIGSISKPARDLVYLAIQHNLLLQGMTREEAEASIGTEPIGPPRLVREGAVTFEEYEYKNYIVRYFENQVIAFRSHGDPVNTSIAQTPASPGDMRIFRLRYLQVDEAVALISPFLGGQVSSVSTSDRTTTFNFSPGSSISYEARSKTIIARGPADILKTLDTVMEELDAPQATSRYLISRQPAPTVEVTGANAVRQEPREIAIIRLIGVAPAEQQRLVEELQELAKQILVQDASSVGSAVGSASVDADIETRPLNLKAVRETLILIEPTGVINVLEGYISDRLNRSQTADLEIAIRSNQPVRGMTLGQLGAALGRQPEPNPSAIRQPDGSIIWEYDFGDRTARFQGGRLIDNAPPKGSRILPPDLIEQLISLGQISEGMTKEQVERSLAPRFGVGSFPAYINSETYPKASIDIDFDGSPIWEYSYPGYFVRFRNNIVQDFVPQAAVSVETSAQPPPPPPQQVTRMFSPRSRTADDLQSIVRTFLTTADSYLASNGTAVDTLPGRIAIDSPTNTLIVTDYTQSINSIESYIRLLDEQTLYQVLVEARFVEMQRNATKRLGIRWNAQGRNPQGNEPFVTVNQGGSAVSTPGGAGSGNAGISFGVLDANSFRLGHIALSDIDVMIEAMEQDGLAKVLQAPRLVTVQNRSATLRAVDRVYDITVTTTTTSSTSTTTATTTTATPVEVGVTLTVTPTVGRDGIITLALSPKVTEAVDVIDASNGLLAGNIINVISERTYDATVQVRSGTTLVIGGLVRQRNRNDADKVPVLARIPILGRIFRSDNVVQNEMDLVIFLNARVVAADGGRTPEDVEGAEPPPPAYETIGATTQTPAAAQ